MVELLAPKLVLLTITQFADEIEPQSALARNLCYHYQHDVSAKIATKTLIALICRLVQCSNFISLGYHPSKKLITIYTVTLEELWKWTKLSTFRMSE